MKFLVWGTINPVVLNTGSIVDPSNLELAIRKAIEDAEHMSSLTIDKISVNITSDKVESNLFEISIPINDIQVTKKRSGKSIIISSRAK